MVAYTELTFDMDTDSFTLWAKKCVIATGPRIKVVEK